MASCPSAAVAPAPRIEIVTRDLRTRADRLTNEVNQLELRDGANALVPASVSYNAATVALLPALIGEAHAGNYAPLTDFQRFVSQMGPGLSKLAQKEGPEAVYHKLRTRKSASRR